MTIVDKSDFVGVYSIGQIGHGDVWARVQAVAETIEAKLLKDVLGAELHGEFVAGLSIEPPADKWVELKALVRPMCVAFVYFWYLRHESVVLMGVGGVSAEPENGRKAEVYSKAVYANNMGVDSLCIVYRELKGNSTYPTFNPSATLQCDYGRLNTLGI